MKYSKFIFDVGANDGVDGLALAINNKDYFVHAFEANPQLCKNIKVLKSKLEKRKGIRISNYKINNYAVSNKKGILNFNISKNHRVSSLNTLSDNLNKSWPGYKDSIFKVVKKIKIKTITLKEFMIKNNIKNINHLHTDTQGSDLDVLKGLEEKIDSVYQGQMEASLKKEKSAYQNNHTVDDVKRFLKNTSLKINKIVIVDHISKIGILNNEVDIYYKNIKKVNKENLNLKYKKRYYQRVVDNRTYLKDNIYDSIIKLLNNILN